jgi:predicted cation transporter
MDSLVIGGVIILPGRMDSLVIGGVINLFFLEEWIHL